MAEASPTKVYDIYAPILNYKMAVEELKHPFRRISWIPLDHLRRIQAYELLSAFMFNYSRDYRFSPQSGDTSQNDTIMEMGDAAWVATKLKDKILGDELRLSIPIPRALTGDTAKADLLTKREAWLQDWWAKQNVYLTIDKNELKCSYLGDAVYMVEWDEEAGAPAIRTYDPGFYFPFLDIEAASFQEGVTDTVKDRVIIAWEEASDSDTTFLIWRDVYELRRDSQGGLHCWRQSAYYEFTGSPADTVEDFVDRDILEGTDTGWVELGIDFVPFVHIPNIALEGETFGLSNLTLHLHNIDGIVNTDTDTGKNSEKLGGAIVFASGEEMSFPRDSDTGDYLPVPLRPATLYPLGKNGRLDVLDTATMQEALIKTHELFESKLIRNTSITEIGAGKKVVELSGVALTVLLQPLLDKIKPMRSQRTTCYTELFWMVQKLVAVFGEGEDKALFGEELYDVRLVFGRIVPLDRKAALEEYTMMKALIGLKATLQIMKEDGWNIDVEAVVSQVEAEETARNQSAAGFGRMGDLLGAE